MKTIATIALLLGSFNIYAQSIFPQERKIKNIDQYSIKEINFRNEKDQVNLSGTLILPNVDFNKIVIIVPGSCLETRHSHPKLTENLLQNNIAVFRYDDRGAGKSEGRLTLDISTSAHDLAQALEAVLNHPQISGKEIGIIGHSYGGLISTDVLTNYDKFDFIILIASPVKGDGALFVYQVETKNKFASHLPIEDSALRKELIIEINRLVVKNKNLNATEIFKVVKPVLKKRGIKKKYIGWYVYPENLEIIRANYEEVYEKINIPLLYIIGDNDKFVDPISNTKLLRSFDNPLISVVNFEGLNHYMTSGELTEVNGKIYDMNSEVLIKILTWIKELN